MKELISRLKEGEERALARAISLVENQRFRGIELMKKIYPGLELPYLVGITGPPGAGKSSLSQEIVKEWLKKNDKVGIIAIDPSSRYSGGALLGDRIRMGEIARNPGVFIRSMATRGVLGGLNPTIFDTVLLMAVAGYEYILIETVGVGQNEIDVVDLADTTLVVTVPEAGDEIQTYKAGLMEIGNIFIVNKADRPGVSKMELVLKQMLKLQKSDGEWTPPVLKTVAVAGKGIDEVVKYCFEHYNYLQKKGLWQEKRRRFLRQHLINLLEEGFRRRFIQPLSRSEDFTSKLDNISNFKDDPYTVAEKYLEKTGIAVDEERGWQER